MLTNVRDVLVKGTGIHANEWTLSASMIHMVRCSFLLGLHMARMSFFGDMPKSPSLQYSLKAQEDIDPRGIRVTNGPMR